MKYDMLILRFGEVTLKGKNRTRFENTALSHVRRLVAAFSELVIRKEYGRIYVELHGADPEVIVPKLQNVFGINSICLVKRADSDLEQIQEIALGFMTEVMATKGDRTVTFKVSARRVWKPFPHGSQEMNHFVGSPILRAFPALKVDVNHPEIDLHIEIRQDGTYMYHEIVTAVGGFPLGSNGKAMLLLSGGIDSPVAGWSALRRGLEIECIHFHSYPFTSERAQQKVLDLAKVLAGFAGKIKVHMVPFTEIQTKFTQVGHDNLIITLMRRSMLRIATKLAEQHRAMALVSGDSLGQVASQTLGSMNVIGKATDIPILRPLVMMDKNEIIEISKKIGTYDLSILPFEDCCTLFVPKNPSTNPNLRVVENIEAHIEGLDEMILEAVAKTETICLRDGLVEDADTEESATDKATASTPTNTIKEASKELEDSWF